jgi:hypothetical protein
LKSGDGTGFAIDGEAHDQRPDEHRDVDSSVALDNIALRAMSSMRFAGKREVSRRRMSVREFW